MNEDKHYTAPELELLYVAIETGFANSLEDPNENEEMDW